MKTKRKTEEQEQQRRREKPNLSRFLPFERFNRKFLKRSQLLTMHRNRVEVNDFLHKHRVWLDANCQDIFTVEMVGDWGASEVMFLNQDDMTLFVLAF